MFQECTISRQIILHVDLIFIVVALHCILEYVDWNLVIRCIYDIYIIDHDIRRLDQQQLRAPPAHPNLILIA